MHPTITDEGNGEIQFHEKILPLPAHSLSRPCCTIIYLPQDACLLMKKKNAGDVSKLHN